MTQYPGFGVLLTRLSQHRKLSPGALCEQAGIPEPDLQAVLDGAQPSATLLRQLGPVFGLHVADLYVIAGLAVPEDLAPLDRRAAEWVCRIAGTALRLPSEHRLQLCQLIESLPQEPRTQPLPTPGLYEHCPPGYGGMLMRMLGNRNLGWMDAARTIAQLTHCRIYLAAATYGNLGRGRKELTADVLAGIATALAIPAEDLAALTGIHLPDQIPPHDPAADESAKLIWRARRLTASQAQMISQTATSLSHSGQGGDH